MKHLPKIKEVIIIILIILLFIYKGTFINIYSNITKITTKENNNYLSEINILKSNIIELSKNLEDLNDTFSKKEYKYSLSKVSYRKTYNNDEFYIYGGENKEYKQNYAIANENGLVGIITKVKEDYSECKILPAIKNLSVVINNSFGSIIDYQEDLFIINNISNYDKININDNVYTSPLGTIKEKILIGYVYKIEDNEIDKIIYVKSNVDYNNINYVHVIGGI